MLAVAVRLALAFVLLASAGMKLASPGSRDSAMATFGVDDGRARQIAWAALIAAELALAAGVAAGSDLAAWLAAALMAMFAALMIGAILRGRAGAPCACFGARSTVGWRGVARNAGLAASFAALPLLPHPDLGTHEWLALGLGVSLMLILGLVVAMLALAREVGMLRLRVGPGSALEVPAEGPSLASRVDVVERFAARPGADLALAVFMSPSCRVCEALRPAIASLAGDPLLAVETFDEQDDAAIWENLDVPGSPYAIALDLDGTVLAKGTFNNLAQLESVLAAAERRRVEWRARGSGAAGDADRGAAGRIGVGV